jgi:hypothetical protein
MGNQQTQADGIARMLYSGCTYQTICQTFQCGKGTVSEIAKMMPDYSYQEG